ncbi:MAG TPA: membrane protein insertion efficiency factor YidD, partial [Microthrixaceae bacterium]|nr:membrane protein insertion efficiency factor YidD [Microthrixaceae bacterium]
MHFTVICSTSCVTTQPLASEVAEAMARLLLTLIRGYQHLFAGRPSPCRFDPTCSSYAIEAISVHGSIR